MQARHDRQWSIGQTSSAVERAAGLEQVLDQVDAPARAVALVAGDDIGRAGRGAEAAMHAGAQDAFQRAGVRIGERLGGEIRLQRLSSHPRVHAAEIEDAVRIEARLEPAASVRKRRRLRRLEDVDRRAQRVRRAHQRRVAAEPATLQRRIAGAAGSLQSVASQTRPPPQS